MVTATKTKSKAKRAASRKNNGQPETGGVAVFTAASKLSAASKGRLKIPRTAKPRAKREEIIAADILVERIDRCPFQPRVDFPASEIAELAASIAAQGQIHPITVRVDPAGKIGTGIRYQLVDGERRWRAVKSLGWKTIRAEVQPHTDAQVRAIVLATAIQRKELGAIEEARAFEAAIAAGDAPGPTELARSLGLSQGHVSNRLRLLELPKDVQARVISREISPTGARALAILKDAPAALAAAVKATAGKNLSTRDFDNEIRHALYIKCRRLESKQVYDYKVHRYFPALPLTAEQRAELKIIQHKHGANGRGKPTEYAANVKLYDKLWAEHKKAVLEKEKKRQGKAAAKEKKAAKKLTPAQAAAKELAKREQFARRLADWREDWLRWLVAGHLRELADLAEVARVMMLGLTIWRSGTIEVEDLEEIIGKAVGWNDDGKAVGAVFGMQDFELDKRAGRLAAKLFFDEEEGPCRAVSGRDLERLCVCLEINPALEWSERQAGPLSEGYWRLHTKEQLVALAGELKAGFADDVLRGTKDGLVAAFVARIPKEEDEEAGLPLPKEIKKQAKGR